MKALKPFFADDYEVRHHLRNQYRNTVDLLGKLNGFALIFQWNPSRNPLDYETVSYVIGEKGSECFQRKTLRISQLFFL